MSALGLSHGDKNELMSHYDLHEIKQKAVKYAHVFEGSLIGTGVMIFSICIWVSLVTLTGFLNAFMIVVLGALVSLSMSAWGRKHQCIFRRMAVLLTLCGGFVGNILAGLALYSDRIGVNYFQVLSSRRIPEDIQSLAVMWANNINIDIAIFYILSIYIAFKLPLLKK